MYNLLSLHFLKKWSVVLPHQGLALWFLTGASKNNLPTIYYQLINLYFGLMVLINSYPNYEQLSMFDFNTHQLKDLRFILEARAERFHRTRTQRKVLMALLDHATAANHSLGQWATGRGAQQQVNMSFIVTVLLQSKAKHPF